MWLSQGLPPTHEFTILSGSSDSIIEIHYNWKCLRWGCWGLLSLNCNWRRINDFIMGCNAKEGFLCCGCGCSSSSCCWRCCGGGPVNKKRIIDEFGLKLYLFIWPPGHLVTWPSMNMFGSKITSLITSHCILILVGETV